MSAPTVKYAICLGIHSSIAVRRQPAEQRRSTQTKSAFEKSSSRVDAVRRVEAHIQNYE